MVGDYRSVLTVSKAEDVVNHNSGMAVVTMADIVSVSTAIDMLSGASYVTLVRLCPLDPSADRQH